MRQVFILIGLISAAVLSTGCASISHGHTQEIKVRSIPEGIDVKLNGMNICKTPCLTQLERTQKGVLTAEIAGFPRQKKELQRKISGAFWANIIFGGIPGWIIDGATGSMYNLSPNDIVFIFDPKQANKIRELWAHPERTRITFDLLSKLPQDKIEPAINDMFEEERAGVAITAKSKIYKCHPDSKNSSGNFIEFDGLRLNASEVAALNILCRKGIIP